MPIPRRRSSTLIPQIVIDQAQTDLQQLPEKPKEKLSLKEAIASLQDTITLALSRGYRYEEVAEILGQQGVNISPTSLKSYLSAAQKSSAPKSTGTRTRQPRGTPVVAEQSTETNAQTVREVLADPEAAPKRRGRKPKAADADPEAAVAAAPTATEEAPAPKQGRRPRAAEPTQTVAKRATPAKKTAAATETSLRSTQGRRKKSD